MKVLLTGATGFLGSWVARELVAAGHDVRALVRKRSLLAGIEGLPLERAEGDVTDRASVDRAVAGCDAAIHSAACVGHRLRDSETCHRVNVDGTRNVLEAALAARVQRVVYTSSIAAIGSLTGPGGLRDEDAPWDLEDKGFPEYMRTKHQAEQIARGLAGRGLPVVILNPGVILGPGASGLFRDRLRRGELEGGLAPLEAGGDTYVNSTRLVLEALRGPGRIHVGGGMAACDVRDVARAHVAALEQGRVGERYVLAGQNVTGADLIALIGRQSGLGGPIRLPYPLAWSAALVSELAGRLFAHRFEELNRPLMRLGRTAAYYSVDRAARELGYVVTPLETTVRDTIRDFLARGIFPAKTPELQALAGTVSAPAAAAAEEVLA